MSVYFVGVVYGSSVSEGVFVFAVGVFGVSVCVCVCCLVLCFFRLVFWSLVPNCRCGVFFCVVFLSLSVSVDWLSVVVVRVRFRRRLGVLVLGVDVVVGVGACCGCAVGVSWIAGFCGGVCGCGLDLVSGAACWVGLEFDGSSPDLFLFMRVSSFCCASTRACLFSLKVLRSLCSSSKFAMSVGELNFVTEISLFSSPVRLIG